ncbi:hypothetical protein VK94_16110 [Bacillus sp. LK7]|nr:hypothetical protein AAV29_13095 [Bacillus velezensis]KMN54288.1 hypothetical protein VK94_16110 [Bacillus sp. LK7]MBR8693486.1 hypothetical protein [Bacillus velezensis]GLZ65647.1 hypothetical protein Bamy02_27000 [Bacillus amyloliquefaciens]
MDSDFSIKTKKCLPNFQINLSYPYISFWHYYILFFSYYIKMFYVGDVVMIEGLDSFQVVLYILVKLKLHKINKNLKRRSYPRQLNSHFD